MSTASEGAARAAGKKAEQQQKKGFRLSEREAKAQRAAVERAASTSQSRINQLEKQAQRSMAAKIRGPDGGKAVARILKLPGLRNARTFEGKGRTTERPVGRDGAVSFHFSVTAVSKGGELADILKGKKTAFTAASTAVRHQAYIEREDALERTRDGGVEDAAQQTLGQAAATIAESQAAQMQAYIEDPEKSETGPGGLLGAVVSSFGTIGDTPDQREAFWKAVEEMEQNPSPPRVTLDPTAMPEVWERIRAHAASGGQIPEPVAQAIANGAQATCKSDNATGIAILQLFRRFGLDDMSQDDGETPFPLRFKLGAGGRIQIRMVMELPHEMTAAQRLALAQEFCQQFKDQATPYWAVIHAPNQHNDHRNFHLHINLSDRPAAQIPHPETGQTIWDFEYVKTYLSDCRHTRQTRGKRQDKLPDMTKMTWIPSQRQRFSEISNAHMANAGIAKRYDPRTYEEMGVAQEASGRVPPAAFARERKGMATVRGVAEAIRQWAANQALVIAVSRTDASHDAYRRSWLKMMTEPHQSRTGPAAHAVSERSKRILDLADQKTDFVSQRNAISHVAARIASRAILVAPRKRDDADTAAVETAAELRQRLVQVDRSIAARGGPGNSDRVISYSRSEKDGTMGKVSRKRHTPEFKAKVALDAMKGEQTLAELGAKHGIHQTMIATWKRQAIDGLTGIFSGKPQDSKGAADKEKEVTQLHAKIGELVVERDFLAKASGR